MAIHFDVTKIKDYQNVCYYYPNDSNEERMRPLTETLIMTGALLIGIGEITEKNVDEHCIRWMMWEQVFGAHLFNVDEKTGARTPRPITRADLVLHIGLETNAIRHTRKEFEKNMMRNLREETERKLMRLKEETNESAA